LTTLPLRSVLDPPLRSVLNPPMVTALVSTILPGFALPFVSCLSSSESAGFAAGWLATQPIG
jgi:hypothetical protein